MLTISVQKRRDVTYELVLKDSTTTAVNLTGCTIRLTVRTRESEPTVIKSYSSAPVNGEGTITITDPTGGKVQVAFDDADFSSVQLAPGKPYAEYRWDLLVITSTGTRLETRDGSDFVQKFVLYPNITD